MFSIFLNHRFPSRVACRLSNNKTFQDLAWNGTHMAKSAAEKSMNEVKSSHAYKSASQTVQQQISSIKQSESFKQLSESDAGKFVQSFVENVKKELKDANSNQSRIR